MKNIQVNIHEAKTQFSRLVAMVASGEASVTVAKAGKPIVDLKIHEPAKQKRTLGGYEDQVKIFPGCFDSDEEMADLFEGNDE